jgi:hypothetical protein
MSEGKDRWQWNHTSELLAMLLNANPWRRGRAVSASALHPYRSPAKPEGGQGVPLTAKNMELLKKVFIDGRTQERAAKKQKGR